MKVCLTLFLSLILEFIFTLHFWRQGLLYTRLALTAYVGDGGLELLISLLSAEVTDVCTHSVYAGAGLKPKALCMIATELYPQPSL